MSYMENKDLNAVLRYFKKDSLHIGTGKNEIGVDEQKTKEIWESSLDNDGIEIRNIEIIQLEIRGDVAWSLFLCDMVVMGEGIKYYFENVRRSIVFEKENGNWMISQWHASNYLIGTEEGIGWPSMLKIKNDINNLIEKLGLNPDPSTKWIELKEYLIQARNFL